MIRHNNIIYVSRSGTGQKYMMVTIYDTSVYENQYYTNNKKIKILIVNIFFTNFCV